MTSPLVSIIIPIYNVEAYLRECLNSVIGQTYRNWECIMVDDASTDASASIAEEYCCSDARFRLLRHPENRGQSYARNSGLDVASGDRIMFVDSDDVIHPSIVMSGVADNADIVCFDLDYSYSRFMRRCSEPLRRDDPSVYDSKSALMKLLYQTGRLNPSPCGKIFKSRMFDFNRFVSGLTYEDLELVCRLFAEAESISDHSPKFYFYRQRPGSYMHQWSRKRLDVLKVTANIEKSMEFDGELRRAARARRFAANFNILLLLRKNGLSRSEEAEECRAQLRRLRRQVLTDRRARLKDRAGALVAYALGSGR